METEGDSRGNVRVGKKGKRIQTEVEEKRGKRVNKVRKEE